MTIATPRLDRLPAAERGITIGDFLVPIRIGERLSARARHIALIVAGALFIYLTSLVVIVLPNNPVPITGQTLGILVVGGALGFRRGATATLLYIVIGILNVPAFAEHRSGIGVIASMEDGRLVLGATGGYLVGFILASAIVGRLAELGWDRHVVGSVAAMLIGSVAIYAVGLPWLMAATGFTPQETIQKGLVPFIPGDIIKLAIAAGIFPIAWWVVGRRPGER
jgi:biotin transport system substrate-specific component